MYVRIPLFSLDNKTMIKALIIAFLIFLHDFSLLPVNQNC